MNNLNRNEKSDTRNKIPLVSVCVQTYQHAPYIKQCLDGILMQKTNFPFEIILGEDESTDGTREICLTSAEKFPDKIRLFLRNEKDKIYIDGQKTGRFNFIENLKAARGKYIALCEGDDYWTDPHKLQKQVDFLENHPECAICFHAFKRIIEHELHNSEIIYPPGRKTIYPLEDFLQYSFIGTLTTVFRNRLFDNFPEWFYRMPQGDWPLHILSAQHGTIGYIDEVMAVHRIHQNGVWFSKGIEYMTENTIKAQEIINSYLQVKYQKINLQSCYTLSYNLTKHYEEQRDIQRARYFAKKCFALRHYNDKNLRGLLKLFFRLYMPSRLVKLIRKLKRF